MIKLLFFFNILLVNILYAQPEIQWQKTIGGNDSDPGTIIIEIPNDGYILSGYSLSSATGDKSQVSRGSYDTWLVRINNNNQIIWQKAIGGSSFDSVSLIKATNDGGFIIGGFSDSNISGEKTENSKGGTDYWILKLNSFGVIQWQKTIGGLIADQAGDIEITADGGYIITGLSLSDISGDKTENCRKPLIPDGMSIGDGWVIKLDAVGTIQWQKTIGGEHRDEFSSIKQTYDGGYIMGGRSNSNISFEKSEDSRGSDDYWVVKLDASGGIEWQRTLGGSSIESGCKVLITSDGNYLVYGNSGSNISGEKTENSRGAGDFWILKLDVLGNIIWQKTIGGLNNDTLGTVSNCEIDNLIVCSTSESDISGEKTENSKGLSDLWVLKLNALGNIIWQKTIGGSNYDYGGSIIQTIDNGYIIGASSLSNISGDKLDNCRGEADYWIVKLAPENLTINDFTDNFAVSIHPNPTVKEIFINFNKEQKDVALDLRNILGEVISYQEYRNINSITTEINGSTGIYLLTIKLENLSKTYRIVKE